ncbi:hypothetical protein ACNQGP_00765 [Flavobacterium sp. GT2N3]|uniref:hypothetical protein n=1 Tax=unclassified Flavobacterium TaxID=196869 RepID=UPI003AB0ED0E
MTIFSLVFPLWHPFLWRGTGRGFGLIVKLVITYQKHCDMKKATAIAVAFHPKY